MELAYVFVALIILLIAVFIFLKKPVNNSAIDMVDYQKPNIHHNHQPLFPEIFGLYFFFLFLFLYRFEN